MKVYTLTFHLNTNFGAIIQAYALAKYLNEQDDTECEILDYHYPNWDNSWHIFHKPRTFRDFLKNIYLATNIRALWRVKRRNKAILRFKNNLLPIGEAYFDREIVSRKQPEADAFVVGSDQVWNYNYVKDTCFFFDFVKKGTAKKLSYAASMADPWPDEWAQKIKPLLEEFDGISLREEGNLPLLKSLLPDKNPVVVCDPVFLLDKSEWLKIASTRNCPKEPYAICYFLGTGSLDVATVAKIRNLLGLKIVHLQLTALDKFNSDKCVVIADPSDFVGLIANASFVITNSFHASALSVIFRKNFTFVPKSIANERIVSLMRMFKFSDVFMTKERLANITKEDLTVDYSQTDAAYKVFTDFSKNYLLDTLHGEKRDSSCPA